MEGYIITEKKKQVGLVALICLVSFVVAFDYGCVNISLSAIGVYFNLKMNTVSWLPTLNLLIITSLLLGFGKLGDLVGYRKILVLGLSIFALGTVSYALSINFSMLLGSRALQSIGQAMSIPLEVAILSAYLPDRIKGKAFGFYATAQGSGAALGQLIGGFLTSAYSWRAATVVTISMTLTAAILVWKVIPLKQRKISDTGFDYLGAILLFIGMAALLYLLNMASKTGSSAAVMLACAVISLIAWFMFFMREKYITYPLLDLNLFKNLDFSFAAIATFLAMTLNIGLLFVFPFYLQWLRHLNVFHAGIIMVYPALTMMLLSPIGGYLSDSLGSRKVCMCGMILSSIAFFMFSLLKQDTGLGYIITGLICLGAGIGLFLAPNNRLVLSYAPEDKHGVASAVYKICFNAGSAVGIAIFTLVGMRVLLFDSTRTGIIFSQIRQHPNLMILGFRGIFIFAVVVSIITLILSALARDKMEKGGEYA